jgi:hypothetical protein
MNSEIKRQWVRKLRSGRYKQAIGVLYWQSSDEFCALGLLGLVCGLSRADLAQRASLPAYVRRRAGLHWMDSAGIAGLNDGEGLTFPEIAEYVEHGL